MFTDKMHSKFTDLRYLSIFLEAKVFRKLGLNQSVDEIVNDCKIEPLRECFMENIQAEKKGIFLL